MENCINELNYFDGTMERNELATYLTAPAATHSGKQNLLKITYGEYCLQVDVDADEADGPSFHIKIGKAANENEALHETVIKERDQLEDEIQRAIYLVVKMARCCPQAFCFNWLEADSYFAGGLHKSAEDAWNNMVHIEKAQCGWRYGTCSRNNAIANKHTGLIDFYEPCEPRLRKKGLPDMYFVKEKTEMREGHV